MLGMKSQLHAFYTIIFGLIWLASGIFAVRKVIQIWRAWTVSSTFQKTLQFLIIFVAAWLLFNLTGISTLIWENHFSEDGWLEAWRLLIGIRWKYVYSGNYLFLSVFAPFWLLGLFCWLQKPTIPRGLFLVAIGSISSPGWESEKIIVTVAAISFFAWFLAVVGLADARQSAGYSTTGHHHANP